MRTKNADRRRRVSRSIIPEYAQAASVALILALIVGLLVPGMDVAAQAEDEPSSFSSQAEAIEYFVAKEQARRQAAAGELASFSSQAEAIEYFVAKEQARREAAAGEPASFSSQAEAIEYFVAKNRLERGIDANATCSRPESVLSANPELAYLGSLESC